MRDIRVSDITMREAAASKALSLSFKEKLEIVKILDRIGVAAIEVEGIESSKVDSLRIKSIASLVKNSTLAVPVKMDDESIEAVWSAAKGAQRVRLQVEAAVSPSTMEYIQCKKADALIDDAARAVAKCAELTDDVEFVAIDATRTDVAYLAKVIEAVTRAGAKTVTVCDAAGSMLPEEFAQFIGDLFKAAPQLAEIELGISCCNNLNMADACAVAGVMAGASLVKATSYPMGVVALDNVARILAAKSDTLDAQCHVRVTELKRAMNQVARLCCEDRSKAAQFTGSVSEAVEGVVLTAGDDQNTVMQYVERLGYSLSDEDAAAVFEAFKKIAANKERVGATELDAIVASAALQVPPTYILEGYVINAGFSFKATSHISLRKDGEVIEVVIGREKDDPQFVISDLLPHLAADQMKKTLAEGVTGEGLNILIGSAPYADEGADRVKLAVMSILNSRYDITEEDFISAELCAVPAFEVRDIGLDRSLIGAYGHDDRVCAYAELKAIFDVKEPEQTCVCILADKEETGSDGVSGMKSEAFEWFVGDMCKVQGADLRDCFAHSICVSADVTAAFDPNYPEVSEKLNTARLNYGVGLHKFTGSRGKAGTNDAPAELVAYMRRICAENGVQWQMCELGKVDQGGGGTVAMYMGNRNIATIDAGVPVLSMHAPFEIVAKYDCYMTYKCVLAAYAAEKSFC